MQLTITLSFLASKEKNEVANSDYLYDTISSNLIFSFAPVVICGVKLNTEEELEELVSERIRKVDRITGTVTVIIAGDKQ